MLKPEYYISRDTLDKLITHYERRARAKRGWSTDHMTEIVRDTLQALRELQEDMEAEREP